VRRDRTGELLDDEPTDVHACVTGWAGHDDDGRPAIAAGLGRCSVNAYRCPSEQLLQAALLPFCNPLLRAREEGGCGRC